MIGASDRVGLTRSWSKLMIWSASHVSDHLIRDDHALGSGRLVGAPLAYDLGRSNEDKTVNGRDVFRSPTDVGSPWRFRRARSPRRRLTRGPGQASRALAHR